ncbi:MAG: molybdate ABC transporter substrate-binding protein [Roseovarius sp.]|nr:molybdate ABC transporter substrate-binding protein [Roseovarius sp.]MCY4208393.1 molybdate ABC transporter substrate-binding protein [Roseovarius sp.]MCY4291245.1 molybdate ABC transporter substrate-binding protein [Roseovarius sp.]
MKQLVHLLASVCALIFMIVPCMSGESIKVFAAASLRNALNELVADYEYPVAISYGGSGQIARQAALGAPVDIVILANEAWMDWLEMRQLLAPDTRKTLLGNRLVLVGVKAGVVDDTAESILEYLDGGRLAMGMTRSVPAGIYGRQWLESTGMWPHLERHLAETENARAALALVSRGETPMGLVYLSDALSDKTLDILLEADPAHHEPIRYSGAVMAKRETEITVGFIRHLASLYAARVFMSHGFSVSGADQ